MPSGKTGAVHAAHRVLATPDVRDDAVRSGAAEIGHQLRSGDAALLRTLLVSGTMGTGTLSLTLDRAALAHRLGTLPDSLAPQLLSLAIPVNLRRRGVEIKLIAGATIPTPDPVLKAALAGAHRWASAIKTGTPLQEVARGAGHHESLVRTRTPLAFLSPKIQRAILDGTQPVDLTLERLVR